MDSGKPGNNTLLTFTTEGIVIQGRIRPDEHGIVSEPGLGLEWFCRDLDEADLCSKFLQKSWWPEAAARDLRHLCQRLDPLIAVTLNPLRSDVEAGKDVRVEVIRKLLEVGFDQGAADAVGWDYAIGEAAWLCAVQRRFIFLRRQVS
jgi:hypothetical protein